MGGMDVSEFASIVKDNIDRLLEEQSISRRELSRRTCIAPANITNILNGEQEIQTDTIQRIADALGVDVMDVVTRHAVATH